MGRPVQWLRELHRLQAEAARSRVETFARRDIEQLFGVGRVQAQALIKAIGGLQAVAGAHFLERSGPAGLPRRAAPGTRPGQVLQARLEQAQPAPRPKPLRIRLPGSLRTAASTSSMRFTSAYSASPLPWRCCKSVKVPDKEIFPCTFES